MSYKPYPNFIVDEEPIELWFARQIDLDVIDLKLNQSTCDDNYIEIEEGSFMRKNFIEYSLPAQGWLINDDEMKTAWERITPSSIGLTTIAPLLIDEDSVDFSSYIVVVEQYVSANFIDWCRVGFSMDRIHDRVGGTVKWLETKFQARFQKTEFINALGRFKKLCDTEWV
jgi:predicted protein tyrosine phosphatase